MGKGDQALVPPEELAGTFYGNGCLCSPSCIRLEVSPACGGGICVIQYCEPCPIPLVCQYMVPCGGKCYFDCDDEGYWTTDADHIDAKCGRGFVRAGKGAPPSLEIER
jgi:hypothetical protein